jgi:hypothetical protein
VDVKTVKVVKTGTDGGIASQVSFNGFSGSNYFNDVAPLSGACSLTIAYSVVGKTTTMLRIFGLELL